MKCPKCKTEITNADANCPKCGLKLIIECPKCKGKVRLGSASCKACGYVFVKFCPRCNSANYVSSPTCRKCFYVFEDEIKHDEVEQIAAQPAPSKLNEPILLRQENKPEPLEIKPKASFNDKRLEILIDFMNLPQIFKKFKDEEFKNKVILNIRTSIKVAFGVTPEFYRESTIKFKIGYNPNNGIYDKIQRFNSEIAKFNAFLNETLGAEIIHKFIILAAGEFSSEKPVIQLAIGHDKDIVTSKAAYEMLNNEISLVKISPDSYKMANVDKDSAPISHVKEIDEDTALTMAYDAIIEENSIKGISINAPRGTGKTHLLGELYNKLKDSDIAILSARCSAMSQVAPFGLFQDAFLNLFNLPFAPSDYKKTTEDLKKLVKKYLPEGYGQEKIDTLINVLYPVKQTFYEQLEANKSIVFAHIRDILETLRMNTKILFAVDDFDLIDESSFEFLIYLIQNNFFSDGSKFILCYRNQNTLNMYIPQEILSPENCLDITLKKREIGSIRAYIKKYLGDISILPRKISDQIIMNAKGDLAYTGQVLYHLTETKRLKITDGKFSYSKQQEDYLIPQDMAAVIELRLQTLLEKSKTEFVILNLASFLGGKFTKTLIKEILDTNDFEIETAIENLRSGGFIIRADNDNYYFKNSLVWTNVYIYAKNNPEMKPYVKALLKLLSSRIISSPAICALLAQIAGNKEQAFELWTKSLQTSSAIGDSALYIMGQKQSLANLVDINHPNEEYIRNNIYERLGKLTYKKNPVTAVQYLSNCIVDAKNHNDINKLIELSGYLTQACRISQNYTAVIETVDNVLSVLESNEKEEIQYALVKTRKLDALLNTGCYEEVVNIVNTEINPILSDVLKNKKKLPYISRENLYNSWIEANITLIEAYSYQGNPLVFELLDVVEKEVYKDEKNIDENLSKKLKLACALAYTTKGIFTQSEEILHTLIKDFSNNDSTLISKWNMITIFNKILRLDFENIKEDLFEAVTYANNNGDNFVKNMLKTILAYVILQEDNDSLRTLEICQGQMEYFSESKIALGALIAWYISAEATLKISGPDKAIEICEKSIQIAENPKICATWFKILFQIFMSKCYILKDDLEAAKMYTELASQDVNQFELNYFMLQIVRQRAVIMQDSLDKMPDDKKTEVALNTLKMFEKALSLSAKLNLENHQYKIQKEITSFKASCKLKRISLDE